MQLLLKGNKALPSSARLQHKSQTLKEGGKQTNKPKKSKKASKQTNKQIASNMLIACWHHRRGGARLHTLNCMHVPVSFISFQRTPGLQAQSLRRNSGHEILLFSLSSKWQYTQLTQAGRHWAHYRGKNALAQHTESKDTGKPSSFALGIPSFWAQHQICIHSACCNWTHTAGEERNESSLYLLTLLCMIWKPVFKEIQCSLPSYPYYPHTVCPTLPKLL